MMHEVRVRECAGRGLGLWACEGSRRFDVRFWTCLIRRLREASGIVQFLMSIKLMPVSAFNVGICIKQIQVN